MVYITEYQVADEIIDAYYLVQKGIVFFNENYLVMEQQERDELFSTLKNGKKEISKMAYKYNVILPW